MPNLPTKRSYGYGAQAFGQGIAQFGAGIVNIASEMQQRQKELVDAAAQAQFADARARTLEATRQFRNNLANDPDFAAYGEKWQEAQTGIYEQFSQITKLKQSNEAYTNWTRDFFSAQGVEIAGDARSQLQIYSHDVLNRNIRTHVQNGDPDAIQQEIDEYVDKGNITYAQGEQLSALNVPLAQQQNVQTFFQHQMASGAMTFEEILGVLGEPGAESRFNLTANQLEQVAKGLQTRQAFVTMAAQKALEQSYEQNYTSFWNAFADPREWATANISQFVAWSNGANPRDQPQMAEAIQEMFRAQETQNFNVWPFRDMPGADSEAYQIVYHPVKTMTQKRKEIDKMADDHKLTGTSAAVWRNKIQQWNDDPAWVSDIKPLVVFYEQAIATAEGDEKWKMARQYQAALKIIETEFPKYAENDVQRALIVNKLLTDGATPSIIQAFEEANKVRFPAGESLKTDMYQLDYLRQTGKQTVETTKALNAQMQELITARRGTVNTKLPPDKAIKYYADLNGEVVYFTKEPPIVNGVPDVAIGSKEWATYGLEWWMFVVRGVSEPHPVTKAPTIRQRVFLYDPNTQDFTILMDKWDDAKKGLQKSGWIK